MRLAENLKAIRERHPLTTAELAKRVTELGRPMLPNTITKIEKRLRRVDIDDAMALAAALGVTLSTLTLPPTTEGTVQLTETLSADAADAWAWADGRRPLRLPGDDPETAMLDFARAARPQGLRNFDGRTAAGRRALMDDRGMSHLHRRDDGSLYQHYPDGRTEELDIDAFNRGE